MRLRPARSRLKVPKRFAVRDVRLLVAARLSVALEPVIESARVECLRVASSVELARSAESASVEFVPVEFLQFAFGRSVELARAERLKLAVG